MIFKLEIECDNAAFDPEPLREVARILRNQADMLMRWSSPHELPTYDATLHDENGNRVGRAVLDAS